MAMKERLGRNQRAREVGECIKEVTEAIMEVGLPAFVAFGNFE